MMNEFDKEIKYRLYRSVREILHPTISKKNISDYKIILNENLLPIRTYYPKKLSDLQRVIIFVHGNVKVTDCEGEYSDICKIFPDKTKSLVLAIEYKDMKYKYKEMYNKIYDTIEYLYKELDRNNFPTRNIILMGDSTGGNIIASMNYINKEKIQIQKEILFYPTLSLEYFGNTNYASLLREDEYNQNILNKLGKYYRYISYKKDLKDALLNPLKQINEYNPKTLIIIGNTDLVESEVKEYCKKSDNYECLELPFLSHGFLKNLDDESSIEVFNKVNEFLI